MGNSASANNSLHFIVIANKNQAQALLDTAEKEDFYLEECHDNKANSLARRNLTYFANQVSIQDNNYAMAYLDAANLYLPIRLLNDLKEVKIVQLMPSADGGMPHTRPDNIICYPDISQLFSKTTLIHELWHIHQRAFKNEWFNFEFFFKSSVYNFIIQYGFFSHNFGSFSYISYCALVECIELWENLIIK